MGDAERGCFKIHSRNSRCCNSFVIHVNLLTGEGGRMVNFNRGVVNIFVSASQKFFGSAPTLTRSACLLLKPRPVLQVLVLPHRPARDKCLPSVTYYNSQNVCTCITFSSNRNYKNNAQSALYNNAGTFCFLSMFFWLVLCFWQFFFVFLLVTSAIFSSFFR